MRVRVRVHVPVHVCMCTPCHVRALAGRTGGGGGKGARGPALGGSGALKHVYSLSTFLRNERLVDEDDFELYCFALIDVY